MLLNPVNIEAASLTLKLLVWQKIDTSPGIVATGAEIDFDQVARRPYRLDDVTGSARH